MESKKTIEVGNFGVAKGCAEIAVSVPSEFTVNPNTAPGTVEEPVVTYRNRPEGSAYTPLMFANEIAGFSGTLVSAPVVAFTENALTPALTDV
jgi:hypothetical protein